MYFFLGNLASLDICCSSVIAPRILFDLHTESLRISKTACISQIFFFLSFISSEVFLLALMSCDRYVAICRPLHYMQIMQWKVCTNMAFGVWIIGIAYSMVHTLCILRLHFCGSNIIDSFFCDLPQLLKISCNDASINNMLIFLLGGLYTLTCFVITFFPYVNIFSTVLRIQAKNKRLKVFSTCTSHLTVVFIFYGTSVLCGPCGTILAPAGPLWPPWVFRGPAGPQGPPWLPLPLMAHDLPWVPSSGPTAPLQAMCPLQILCDRQCGPRLPPAIALILLWHFTGLSGLPKPPVFPFSLLLFLTNLYGLPQLPVPLSGPLWPPCGPPWTSTASLGIL
ncbi:olfactory receptor 1C1-like [Discoglossus pictus]